ncbi:uncharacterized protein [Periplaneta americana]|uniref:uncharacterized protein n=1 Tax=Periplaneta americana TaxID=6978 RepID=UPI0037E867E9
MKGFLSTLLVCFVAYSATAAPECDLGKQIIDKVDTRIINGLWKLKYLLPKSFSAAGRCWELDYHLSANGVAQLNASNISPKTGEIVMINGAGKIIQDHNVNVTFPKNPEFDAVYHVLAWEEEKGYKIVGGCVPLLNYNPLIWISYRHYPPSEESLEASKVALKKTGLKLEDFDINCDSDGRHI